MIVAECVSKVLALLWLGFTLLLGVMYRGIENAFKLISRALRGKP